MATRSDLLIAERALGLGLGRHRIIPFAAPAPGSEFSVVVPGSDLLWWLNFRYLFTATAAAANRDVVLGVSDGTTTLYEIAAATPVSANQVRNADWPGAIGDGTGGADPSTQVTPYPPMWVLPGWRIFTVTANLQAGDTMTGLQFWAYAFPIGLLGPYGEGFTEEELEG